MSTPERRPRLDPAIFHLPVERMRAGYYSDKYFVRAREVLRRDGYSPHVTMQVFGKADAFLGGIDEAIAISNSTAYGLSSAVCTNRLDYITRFISELNVGTVNVREVPGYRLELTPFGGIKDSGLGYKEGVLEAMKSFTNVRTWSLPWPG